jgi:hypothetical protein
MPVGRFGPCPHCNQSLSFLEGVSGSTMHPMCPTCRNAVPVTRATFIMVDTSRPSKFPPKVPAAR